MKQRSPLRLVLWIAASVLLVNPMPMLFDPLPDALGFLLLWLALGRLSSRVPAFADAREATKKVGIVTAIKIPAWIVMMAVFGGNLRERSIIAVFCFVFSILELCYLIPWIRRLFEAFYQLGERHDCAAAIAPAAAGHRLRLPPERLEALTLVFFSVRAALSCLPEMTLVPVYDSAEEYARNWNRLYVPLAIVAAVIVLAFGIVWLVHWIAYLRRVSADAARSPDLICAPTLAVGRRDATLLRAASIFYVLGVVLTADLYVERINYLSDAWAALAFLVCGICLQRLLRRGTVAWIAPIVYGVAGVTHTVLWTRFFRAYSIGAIERVETAAEAYRAVLLVSATCEALLAVTAILLFFALRRVVGRYTGIPIADVRYAHTEAETRRSLMRANVLSLVGAILTAATSFFYELSLADTIDVATEHAFMTVPRFSWSLLLLRVVTVFWVLAALHFLPHLCTEAIPRLEAESEAAR